MLSEVKPIIDYSVRNLCCKPYPGHTKGCPNYRHKEGCPPEAPLFGHVYAMSKPIYAIINKFDLAEHRERMRLSNPSWSQRQLDCCLYWQPRARKQLMIYIRHFLKDNSEYHVTTCPEAMGIDVTRTLTPTGIILEWPPVNFTYQVALAGIYRKCRICGCTWFNGCKGGCNWVEKDLCSSCRNYL